MPESGPRTAVLTADLPAAAAPPRRPARATVSRHRRRAGYALLSPAATVLLLTTLLPLLFAVVLSFLRYDLLSAPHFAGVDNYRRVLTDPTFWSSIRRTLYFAVAQVPIGAALALGAALVLNRVAGGGLYRTVVYLPQAASYVVVALIWSFLYDPRVGPLDAALRDLGAPTAYWLTNSHLAMPALVTMSIWRNLGYFMVIYVAALQGIPRELHEAAAVDGAGAVARFRFVTVPMLRPVTGFVLVTWFLGALQMFTQAYVMTEGGPVDATTTVVYRIYQESFVFLRIGTASAIAVLLFVAVAVVALGARRVLGRRGDGPR